MDCDFELPESGDELQVIDAPDLPDITRMTEVPHPLAVGPDPNCKLFFRSEEIEDDFVLISEN